MLNESCSFQKNNRDSIKYRFYNGILKSSGNKHLIRWANRHHYHAFGVEIVNLSGDFRKGFQLKFYINQNRLIPVNNQWFAKKARQKMSAAPFIAIPFFVAESAIFHSDPPRGSDGFEIDPDYNTSITGKVVEADNKRRKHANAKFLNDLKELDLSYKVVPTGKPVYGIVIFKEEFSIDKLTVSFE